MRRHIRETCVLEEGGLFMATSSEISPPISPANVKAMVDAAGEMIDRDFGR